jgi:hypothetical protein
VIPSPSCLLYLFVTVLEYFSYRPLKALEDLQSLGLRVEEVPAFMKAFLESGQTIHLIVVEVEDLERTMGFLEEMYTKDEIQRCVLQQYLKDLKQRRKYRSFTYGVLDYQHFDPVCNWASRLGCLEIVVGINAIRWKPDMELPESESVSNQSEDM